MISILRMCVRALLRVDSMARRDAGAGLHGDVVGELVDMHVAR